MVGNGRLSGTRGKERASGEGIVEGGDIAKKGLSVRKKKYYSPPIQGEQSEKKKKGRQELRLAPPNSSYKDPNSKGLAPHATTSSKGNPAKRG